MKETYLTKIALLISVIGVAILFIVSLWISPAKISISQITGDMLGDVVVTCGGVSEKSVSSSETLFFKLAEVNNSTAEISVVFFSNTAKATGAHSIENGQTICVEGEIALYKQALELIGRGYETT